ncbi:MAG: LytTR family DNA-binding domain-containing protein [bacterium]|nr:LytTR family DNA-binding domain-containing protein [bacterium]
MGEIEKLRVVIADDESPAREGLRYFLDQIPGVEIVAEASNGKEALEMIGKNAPDLAFLDIRMPGLDGLEVAQHLKDLEERPRVVFVTAYNKYALKAFESWAMDYLLKPVDFNRLKEVVERARQELSGRATAQTPPWEDLLRRLGSPLEQPEKKRISIRKAGSAVLINPDDIICFAIEDGVVNAYGSDFKGMVNYRTLEEIERDFGSGKFFRSHRGFLINLNRIDQINRTKLGSYELTLSNRKTVPLSRRKARDLRKLIKW